MTQRNSLLFILAVMIIAVGVSFVYADPTLPRDSNNLPIQNMFRPVYKQVLAMTDSTSARSDSIGAYHIIRVYSPSATLIKIGNHAVTSTDSTGFILPKGTIGYFPMGIYKYIAARTKAATGDTLYIDILE